MTELEGPVINAVAFGGGTGMPNLLRDLCRGSVDVTAAVVVSDDGGSSGELRNLYNMPAPGDLRNVIVALGEADQKLLDLLQFRFDDELLEGHCFGNLALAALTQTQGSFEEAVRVLCQLANVRGRVIPAAFEKVALVATHEDGSKSTGEVTISSSDKPISRVSLKPSPSPASEELIYRIKQADMILFGPGSLFTSLVPHLLVPGVIEAIQESDARVIYVSNIMTQPGETKGFDLNDHVRALYDHGLPRLDVVLCHDGQIPESCLENYQDQGAAPVKPSEIEGVELWIESLIDSGTKLRHCPQQLAKSLIQHFRELPVASEAKSSATVVNESGLHTRPASQIVKLANQYRSKISLSLRGQVADAQSIMDLILLTATCGSQIEIAAQGEDAEQAVHSLTELINSGFETQVVADGNS